MRRISISGAVFLFMERREKLTFETIWRDSGEVYTLCPHGEYWDVRYRAVTHGKLERKQFSDKPFPNEDEAWQAAYMHWEHKMVKLWEKKLYKTFSSS